MIWEAGDAAGEKDPHVVLMQEVALVGSQRKATGLSSDFSFKAFGVFLLKRLGILGRLVICT